MAPEPVLLHRIDPSRNMARFYRLSIEPNLFGGVSLVRTWGRIGREGRMKTEIAADRNEAGRRLETWRDRKLSRGYSIA